MTQTKKGTPMLEQYWRLKAQQPEALLLFRLGDFYELFEGDAEIAAPVLDLQLTSRDGRVPMCGIPYHALGSYARQLLENGYTVAIAEQMEDPQLAKGLVDRQIVRVLTPGTVIPEEDSMAAPRLGVLYQHRAGWVALAAELSTGTLHVAECSADPNEQRRLEQLWAVWRPDEYLSNADVPWTGGRLKVDAGTYFRRTDPLRLERLVVEEMGLGSLRRWDLEGRPAVQEALGALWRYLDSLAGRAPQHLKDIRVHALTGEMMVSERALKQLDIVEGPYSLLSRIDRAETTMGSRRVKEWLEHPLVDASALQERHRAVAALVAEPLARAQLRERLARVGDLSRRLARLVMGIGRPRDAAGIAAALKELPEIWKMVHETGRWTYHGDIVWERVLRLAETLDMLEAPAPARWEDTPLIRAGADDAIDGHRHLLEDQRQSLLALEEEERERSGIKSLRVGYHRTFGYYLEVTRSQAKNVPDDWHRRQTTAHTERFESERLRTLEIAIQDAEVNLKALERAWAERIQASVVAEAAWLSETASWLADVDALSSLAEAAVANRYHPPEFQDTGSGVSAEALRHPVLDGILTDYVTSDLAVPTTHSTLIITGPNMGGKSTFMRALAQNVILAQSGSWVAADQFRAPLFDAVLTRIGADDDLVRGQSTFMVEMEEVSAILHQATGQSLVMLDELGRGTSTYDGLAIAQAVIERLAMPDGPLTLFATHYHEITGLAEQYDSIDNLTVEVLEASHGLVFTHRVVPGRASQSYGIEVARQAGLPPAVVRRAEGHLKALERGARPEAPRDRGAQLTFDNPDPEAGPLLAALRALELDDLSPREAWLWLQEWQRRICRGGS